MPAEAAALAGTWRREDASLGRWTLRAGQQRYDITADEATAKAIFAVLEAFPIVVQRLQREVDALKGETEAGAAERDALLRERDALKKTQRAAPAPPPKTPPAKVPTLTSASGTSSTSLEDVPLAMIGTFALSPKLRARAKTEPLIALAVQVDKAMGSQATELDRARLLAMAAAIGRGDLETFWAASTQRSKKKLAP